MFTGIIIIALPVGVIGSSFSRAYEEMEAQLEEEKKSKAAATQAAEHVQVCLNTVILLRPYIASSVQYYGMYVMRYCHSITQEFVGLWLCCV
jgi:hypothetical protein